MRSLLIVADVTCLRASLRSGADALVMDQGLSASAEAAAVEGRPALIVKISPIRSARADAELDAAMPSSPDAIYLTDTIGGRDVQHLAAKLAVREAELGLPDGATRILASVDSAAGLLAVGTIPGASGRLKGLTWDPVALARDIGADSVSDASGTMIAPLQHARSMTLFVAAAAAVPAIDAACLSGDEGRILAECRLARRDGFGAKITGDPSQATTINEVFAAI